MSVGVVMGDAVVVCWGLWLVNPHYAYPLQIIRVEHKASQFRAQPQLMKKGLLIFNIFIMGDSGGVPLVPLTILSSAAYQEIEQSEVLKKTTVHPFRQYPNRQGSDT